MSPLSGTAALVTGGGSGIGLGCARRLAADGADVTTCGRTESRLRKAAEEIGARHVVADITSEEQVAAAVAYAAADHPLRAVVPSHHLRRGPDYSALFAPMFGAEAREGHA